MHLGQHPNVEVRLFNPFPGGRSALWTRIAASMSEILRINHRMHNKLFVADNALAITGGRNIGDQYFTRDLRNNFIDLDVIAAGPIVPQLSASFDAFWNSKYAYPIASVAAPVQAETLRQARRKMPSRQRRIGLAHELDSDDLQLSWVPARVLADPARENRQRRRLQRRDHFRAQHPGADALRADRGHRDLSVLHSGTGRPCVDARVGGPRSAHQGPHEFVGFHRFAVGTQRLFRYRVALLKMGVELSEVRPQLGQKRKRFHPFKSSNASLHAKALVIDQNIVFVGSMNMDARSARTNSELGLVVRSPEIARQVTSLLDDISADGSYRLSLDSNDHIVWSSGEPGSEKVWHIDPETTRMQRFLWRALAPFAPEEML